MKKQISILLCLVLMISYFSGCNSTDVPQNGTPDGQITHETEETVYETEARMPIISDNTISMYYDDVLSVSELTEGDVTVEISNQQVTSRIVGTLDSDNAVVYYHKDNQCLIAVGTGTATVTVNDTAYTVTVSSAPISLFMITGHSIGAGQTGVPAQSVLCFDGQAYSMHGTRDIPEYEIGTGIGFAADVKIVGINAFTSSGAGTQGEGSAFAWQWNNLTGEKVWVLNAAIGGSCLNEWAKGQTFYNDAVKLFRYAQQVLTAEIAAGHYRLKDMAIIYHSAANYGYKGVIYTNDLGEFWYDSMWNGFKSDLAMDMDGDGETETVQAMGFVPIWTDHAIHDDKLANFYMGASDSYKDMFMASLAGKGWLSNDDLQANFPEINYTTHGETVEKPTSSQFIYSDGVHYIQVAYNALGLDIAENTYRFLRTKEVPESIELKRADGNKVYDDIELRVGRSIEILPVVEPISVNDLTFTISNNLEISFPCVITAKTAGIGTLTVSHGDQVLKTITFTIED